MKNVFAAVLALFCLSSIAQEKKPIHLFILTGQSNMAGLKPENGFLPEAKKLLPDGEVVHLKVARGGRPIRLWIPEWNDIAAKHGLDVKNEETPYYDQIMEQVKAIKAKHPEGFASVSFCWMQGERDAKEKLSAAYEESLNQLISNLRRDLEAPKMTVVIGRLSDFSPGGDFDAHWDKVREVQVKVSKDDPHGAWVDTDDLNDKIKKEQPHNDLHYTKEGYETFGKRLAQQSVKLIKGEAPSETGR